ncbi:DUF2062 domain-containing protein [Fodinicurvata halophila]|uniref:DUF2062 domain-containing protein n=1 Tax=Fodinicurvata halophila TaxID=1419723 RepID=A0ABV8UJ97_9PROT
MLFRPRSPRPFFKRLRNAIWPRRSWKRSARYVGHRLGRIPSTPYSIAAGFASGAAISFTPLLGFHFLGGGLIALLLRGNLLASAIGTVVGNPWTFPFIWAWTFSLGRWILGHADMIETLPQHISMNYIFDHPSQVLLPMLVGSLPTALVVWSLFFWIIYRLVEGYQKARHLRLEKAKRRLQLRKAREYAKQKRKTAE